MALILTAEYKLVVWKGTARPPRLVQGILYA